MNMYQKTVTTITLCFYYLYFLAICEAIVWLEQSSIIILSFTGIHIVIKIYQFVDYGASNERNLYPYRKLSTGFRNLLILADTLVTFIVLFGYLFIENKEEYTDDKFSYLLCFACFLIVIPNIIKHHKRQVEVVTTNSMFSQDFDDII